MKKQDCRCFSKNSYAKCCQPFHKGHLPNSAVKLMRSRYCAYALKLPQYIISTTHPKNSGFHNDSLLWSKQIMQFCLQTEFTGLEIIDFEEGKLSSTVTFHAHLFQNKKDVSFTEKSSFEIVNGKWLYLSGQIFRKSF